MPSATSTQPASSPDTRSAAIRQAYLTGPQIAVYLIAAIVAFSGKDFPLGIVGAEFGDTAVWIGGIAFVIAVAGLYRWAESLSRRATA